MARYEYPLDNEWRAARERLGLLEAAWDPWTQSCFLKIGVKEGWRCLEIAGGGGSIAEWLCRRVGPTGRVVAIEQQMGFAIPLLFTTTVGSLWDVLRHHVNV